MKKCRLEPDIYCIFDSSVVWTIFKREACSNNRSWKSCGFSVVPSARVFLFFFHHIPSLLSLIMSPFSLVSYPISYLSHLSHSCCAFDSCHQWNSHHRLLLSILSSPLYLSSISFSSLRFSHVLFSPLPYYFVSFHFISFYSIPCLLIFGIYMSTILILILIYFIVERQPVKEKTGGEGEEGASRQPFYSLLLSHTHKHAFCLTVSLSVYILKLCCTVLCCAIPNGTIRLLFSFLFFCFYLISYFYIIAVCFFYFCLFVHLGFHQSNPLCVSRLFSSKEKLKLNFFLLGR